MLSMRAAVVLGALGGCLAKPPPPGDASDVTPPGECPTGATKFPADVLVRRDAEVVDLDGDGREDVILWGREADGAGKAFVYVVHGRAPMSLACHDLAFPLGDVEPLDVWFGDVTGDCMLDMVVVSRDTEVYPVHLYRGVAGGLDPQPDIQAPTKAQYGQNVGGTMNDPFPVFVVGYHGNGASEVIFGGLDEPFAGFVVTATGLESDRLVRDDVSPANGLGIGQIEGAGVTGMGEQRLVVVSGSSVATFANVGREPMFTKFARLGPTSLHGSGPQTVRWLRTLENGALVGVTEVNDGDFDIIRATVAAAPDVMLLPADIERTDVRDVGLGRVDAGAGIDLAVLAQTFVRTELTLFRDLVLVDPVGHEVPLKVEVPAGSNLLALGDFDGDASTPDQILVLPTTSPTTAACFHVVPGIPQACVVSCDVAACP